MEEELEKKQTFLRTNILEKGYDAEEFMNFLQTKKGEFGLDLNNWNINELKTAVQEFISSLDKDNILINPQNINKEGELDNNLNTENNNNNLENNENDNKEELEQEENPIQNKQLEDIIQCEKVTPSELNDENNNKEEMEQEENQNTNKSVEDIIECQKVTPNEFLLSNDVDIKLSFPQKIEGGLFTKSYVTYLMQTTPLDFKLRH